MPKHDDKRLDANAMCAEVDGVIAARSKGLGGFDLDALTTIAELDPGVVRLRVGTRFLVVAAAFGDKTSKRELRSVAKLLVRHAFRNH